MEGFKERVGPPGRRTEAKPARELGKFRVFMLFSRNLRLEMGTGFP